MPNGEIEPVSRTIDSYLWAQKQDERWPDGWLKADTLCMSSTLHKKDLNDWPLGCFANDQLMRLICKRMDRVIDGLPSSDSVCD